MTIETPRLLLRPPARADAPAIFDRWATDAEVLRYVSFRQHRSLEDTQAFLAFSDEQWARWSGGPLLVFRRADRCLLGSSGLAFETPYRAATGYVFARDAWGHGYATETLAAMVAWARDLEVWRLYAHCHVEHAASARVLEKCGFAREGVLRRHIIFPNLSPEPADVLSYALALR